MTHKDDKNEHRHEYERENPGGTTGTPHRPDSSYGVSKGKAGGTYGDAEDAAELKKDKDAGKNTGKDAGGGTPGGQKPEKVSDRPNVSTVRPEDYPKQQRRDSRP